MLLFVSAHPENGRFIIDGIEGSSLTGVTSRLALAMWARRWLSKKHQQMFGRSRVLIPGKLWCHGTKADRHYGLIEEEEAEALGIPHYTKVSPDWYNGSPGS